MATVGIREEIDGRISWFEEGNTAGGGPSR